MAFVRILTPQMSTLIYKNWPDVFDKIGSEYSSRHTSNFENMLKTGWRPSREFINKIISNFDLDELSFYGTPRETKIRIIELLYKYNLITNDEYQDLMNP